MTRPAREVLAELEARAAEERLGLFGLCHTVSEDGLGEGTLVLMGPAEPGFWAHFTLSPEFRDGAPDPMDRWSGRVIEELAKGVGGAAVFPFGSPVRPFVSWALRGGAFVSPVTLLVHPEAGLWVSYRGAVVLPGRLELPAARPSPCESCADKPCLTACPVGALTGDGYDLAACHAYLDSDPGRDCMARGCAVRRSCPAGAGYRRVERQSAYHMERFHP